MRAHQTTKTDKIPVAASGMGRVVAAVYSKATLAAALALPAAPAAPDWLELRLDHFHRRPGQLDELVRLAPRPLIVTVRHPAEGGAAGAPGDPVERQRLFERTLGLGVRWAAIDLEVRSLAALRGVVRRALTEQIPLIASLHDFRGVPTEKRLHESARRAVDAGAQIFKVAAKLERPRDLARLLEFSAGAREFQLQLAVMGMGRLGKVTRLALAVAGSVLNYGYLGAGPQVPGQWPAQTLRDRLEELSL